MPELAQGVGQTVIPGMGQTEQTTSIPKKSTTQSSETTKSSSPSSIGPTLEKLKKLQNSPKFKLLSSEEQAKVRGVAYEKLVSHYIKNGNLILLVRRRGLVEKRLSIRPLARVLVMSRRLPILRRLERRGRSQ